MNNPYILSHKLPVGNNSFIDSRQSYHTHAPPPKYFTNEFLLREYNDLLPVDRELVLVGMEYPVEGGLICTD